MRSLSSRVELLQSKTTNGHRRKGVMTSVLIQELTTPTDLPPNQNHSRNTPPELKYVN